MAWQTPKTNWAAADGVRDTDLNRIEGNILELYNVDAVRSNRTVYVSTTGNDSSGLGTSASPYATITKALSVLPKNLNGRTTTVSIAAGTYAEQVTISDFSNGILALTCTGTVTVQRLTVSNCVVQVTGNLAVNTSGVIVTTAGTLICNASLSVSGGSVGVTVTLCSRVHISGNLALTNMTTGIFVTNASTLFATTLSGSGVGSGMNASNGGMIAYGSSSLTVSTYIQLTSSGGRINTGSQSGTGGGGVL